MALLWNMRRRKLLIAFFSFFFLARNPCLAQADFIDVECLTVPSSVFANSIKATLDMVSKVTSTVAPFANAFADRRLSNAINDCLDLLDFSNEELTWSLSATQNPNGKDHNGTGDRRSDLGTWLSAALGNQDTCLDGFEGTNSFVKQVVAGSLNQLTSLVRDILGMVDQFPSAKLSSNSKSSGGKGGGKQHPHGRKLKSIKQSQFPWWVKAKDRKLLQAGSQETGPDVVVAADGTGNFERVMDAVQAAPDYSTQRYVIYVKRGIYLENVEIKKKKWNLMLIGDGMDVTIISGNRSFIDGWTTFRSATFAVSGKGFIARDLTFQNTAGPEKHQAVALRSDSDLSVFFRCAIRGYQDTLYTHSLRQFYRECAITGTVDFIFGNGAVVFQNCRIGPKQGLPNQKNTITAQGRKDPNQNTGFSIQFCNISADSDLIASTNSTLTYLGRPWKLYSRTIIMQSYISSVVQPQGWLEWNGDFALDTLFYAEYMNYGPGAALASRVTWPGFHVVNQSSQANNFTVAQFIDGNLWLPSTGVKYTAGLLA